MTARIATIYLLGCLTGAAAVGLWVHFAARAATASTPTTGESQAVRAPNAPEQIQPSPTSTIAASAAPVPKAEPARIDQPNSASSVQAPSADAAPTAYDFSTVTNSERKIEQIFSSERSDPVWSSQTVDSLNLLLSQMPERSVIGDYGLTCKESLCKLEITGPTDQIMSARRENNIQPALLRLIGEPPGNTMFDDSMMRVEAQPNGQARITLYAHRRKGK
jgi:hypothetical protein